MKTADSKLTRKQLKYVRELREIFAIFDLDFESVEHYPEKEERTAHLERILDHIVRGEIISTFTIMDDLLTRDLARAILEPRVKKITTSNRVTCLFEELTQARLSMIQKLRMLRLIKRVPKHIGDRIIDFNKLRNLAAHRFLLHGSKPAQYRGRKILTLECIKAFQADRKALFDYFVFTPLRIKLPLRGT